MGKFPFVCVLATGTFNSVIDEEALFESSGGFKPVMSWQHYVTLQVQVS